jgi:hypothetical protein
MTSGVQPAGCDQTKVNLTSAKMRHSRSSTRTSSSAEGSSGKHALDVEVRHTPYAVISVMAFDQPPRCSRGWSTTDAPTRSPLFVHWEAIAHQYTRYSFDRSIRQSRLIRNPLRLAKPCYLRSPIPPQRLFMEPHPASNCVQTLPPPTLLTTHPTQKKNNAISRMIEGGIRWMSWL